MNVVRAGADDGSGGAFVALSPDTIANTSNGTGDLGNTPFAANETRTMSVAGDGGIPASGVSAAVLEMVVSNQTIAGSLSLYPDDAVAPATSDLSFDATNKASGFAIVALGSDGGINVQSVNGNPNVIVTVEGYFTSSYGADESGGYNALSENRILDLSATPLAGGATTTLQVGGNNGVPSDAGSIFVNLGTSSASASGGIFVWPHGQTMPNAATLRWTPGLSSTGAVVALGSGGAVDIYNSGSQSVALTVDLDGYFAGGVPSGGGFNVASDRLFDTTLPPASALGANQTVSVPIAGAAADLPQLGWITSAAINLSVTTSSASGSIRVWGTGLGEPTTTDLDYDAGGATSSLSLSRVGSDGTITLRNVGTGTVNLTVDIQGWFTDTAPQEVQFPGAQSSVTGESPMSPADESQAGWIPATPSCGGGTFNSYADYVHVTFAQASGHGWWKNFSCTAATTATVTVQLESYWNDGLWRYRGAPGVADVYPGGGAGKRATAKVNCTYFRVISWRSWVDVNLDGVDDPPGKRYSDPVDLNCATTPPA